MRRGRNPVPQSLRDLFERIGRSDRLSSQVRLTNTFIEFATAKGFDTDHILRSWITARFDHFNIAADPGGRIYWFCNTSGLLENGLGYYEIQGGLVDW
ncbi:hypothetical protein ACFL2Q_20375 [Thermodesulfobacteriota bacterium]